MKTPVNPTRLLCSLVMMAMVVGCTLAREPIAGGQSTAKVDSPGVVGAAQFAIQQQEKQLRLQPETRGANLRLVSILSATEQVVAGVNYRVRLKVTLNGAEKKAMATVWWQAWRTPDPYQLSAWEWQ